MMEISRNLLRNSLKAGQMQLGLWVGLANANAAEALAGCGYDWLLFDAEHAPNDVRSLLEQLRAIAPYPVHPVVRPPTGDIVLIKQYLDIGAQTLLIPTVDTAEQAAMMVSAMRYPPQGMRGVGASLARASRYSQVTDYLKRANDEMCLLVQAETPLALENLHAIATTEGVDGVFFGPADLSAQMGHRGQPDHPDVQSAILEGITTVRRAGKAAGILMADRKLAQAYINAGAQFVAVGVDTTLLVRAATELAQSFRQQAKPTGPDVTSVQVY